MRSRSPRSSTVKGIHHIGFYVDDLEQMHAEADIEHSRRQAELCTKYLDTDVVKARALEVAEQACMLRWASVTDLSRRDYLGEKDILPAGVR